MNQSPNRNTGKPTSHRENPLKLADNLGAAVSRLELVAYYVQLTQSHLWMHQTWSERERGGNGEQSSRGVGRVGTMAAVNSRDKNRLEKRSSCRAWCTFGRHFFSSASARCAVAHVRLRWRRRRRLVAVGENFPFWASLAWQLGRRKGVFAILLIVAIHFILTYLLLLVHISCCFASLTMPFCSLHDHEFT